MSFHAKEEAGAFSKEGVALDDGSVRLLRVYITSQNRHTFFPIWKFRCHSPQRWEIRQNTWTHVLNTYYSVSNQGYSAKYVDISAYFA